MLFGKSLRALPALLATMIPDQSTYDTRYQVNKKHTDEILNELSAAEIIETEKNLESELSKLVEDDKQLNPEADETG